MIETKTLNIRGELLLLHKPLVMGILNITPDSFYDGGKFSDIDKVKRGIENMLEEGVDIIDIGAMSSRPGAEMIDEKTEWERLEPVLKLINKYFTKIPFSIDTIRASIAEKSLRDYGAAMINDISAGNIDAKMFDTIAKYNVPYIIMHMRGTSENMQKNTEYGDIINEILYFFSEKINKLNQLGINDIIIDPGFGFSKTIEQNYFLLNNLDKFNVFELPLMAGLSRKSMAWKYLGITPEEALCPTQSLNTIAINKGVNIIRVHDVKPARQLVDMYCKMKEQDL